MIKAQYEHGKFGTFMFNLTAKWAMFLAKHRWLYYLLNCTWGLLLTLLGCIITLVLLIYSWFDQRTTFKRYDWIYCIMVAPEYWGGFETGLMYVRDLKSSGHIDAHEFGHTIQNALFGPLTPFLITIPSVCRYWQQTIREMHGKDNKPYDKIWFEDSASQCGLYVHNYIKNKNK